MKTFFLKILFWKNDNNSSFRIDNTVVANWFNKTQSIVFSEKSAKKEEIVLRKLISTNQNTKILDLGCGDGRYAKLYSHNISKYVGIDISETFIINDKELIKSNNIEFIHSAAHEFIYPDKFDYILLIGLITYMNDDEISQMCDNCVGMLNDQGKIILRNVVNTKNKRFYYDDKLFFIKYLFGNPRYQIIRRTEDQVIRLFNRNFKLLNTLNILDTGYNVLVWGKKNEDK
ncbi:MAG: class I SAM-dependent methyltransferase [Mariniphaga sp.]|nr:class I SAM-dependent methyltransferase [Mariniphaga sp.]